MHALNKLLDRPEFLRACRQIATPLSTSWDAALSLIYPNECQICHQEPAQAHTGFVGARCEGRVQFLKPPLCLRCGLPFHGEIHRDFTCTNCRHRTYAFDRAQAAVQAKGPVLDAIHQYKYRHALWMEPFLLQCWLPIALEILRNSLWQGIVPVPLHPTRQREREFNQAERLARALGRSLRIPVRTDLVQRHRFTVTQTQLHRDERLANMHRAFSPHTRISEIADRCPIAGRWIVVDDVFTTGATTHAVSAVLKSLGAEHVVVWTVARGT